MQFSVKSQLGFNLTGSQLGQDFYKLKKLLAGFPMYQNSTLVGPDINNVGDCLPDFDEVLAPYKSTQGKKNKGNYPVGLNNFYKSDA